MTEVFPIGLKLNHKRCVVFGAGPEQATRAQALLNCGARVRVIAQELAGELQPALEAGALEHFRREYARGDLRDAWLAVQVNFDPAMAEQILEEAERERVFFCAVDQPASSYSHLAQARAGALLLAIGTSGRAPALARRLRQLLQGLLDSAGAAEAVERIAELRERTAPSERRAVMQQAMERVHLSGALRFDAPSPPARDFPPGNPTRDDLAHPAGQAGAEGNTQQPKDPG